MDPLEKYRCGECGETHSDEDDAHDCCRPMVTSVFECPIFHEEYLLEEDAIKCIDDCEGDGEAKMYMASKAELEARGQERLF